MIAILKVINMGVAFGLELCMLAALGYYGFHNYDNKVMRFIIGLGLPAVAIALWAYWGAPKSNTRLEQPYRIIFELGLMLVSAVLLYKADKQNLAVIFGVTAIVSQVLGLVWRQ